MGANGSHETYESTNSDWDGRKYKAKFEPQPFKTGECRNAFMGILNGEGPMNGQACVTKVFKKEFAEHISQWIPDLEASRKSLKFARQFNTDCISRLNSNTDKRYKEIDFVIPLIAKMCDVPRFKVLWLYSILRDESLVRRNEYVLIEPFLNGVYTKFNSNGGYEDEIHQLMLAFSHWTWVVSEEQFMVCDLQGIETQSKFILTDPAVHSRNRSYGITDLGVAGMNMVLSNHTCNRLCIDLGLDNPLAGLGNRNVRLNTRYYFQLSTEEQRWAF